MTCHILSYYHINIENKYVAACWQNTQIENDLIIRISDASNFLITSLPPRQIRPTNLLFAPAELKINKNRPSSLSGFFLSQTAIFFQ